MDGNLFELIRSNDYTELWCQYVLYKTLLSLKCLHDRQVIHRNLKSKNVLFNHKGDVKLCDLSCSALLTENNGER
jgi:serine/threonine protein kinase